MLVLKVFWCRKYAQVWLAKNVRGDSSKKPTSQSNRGLWMGMKVSFGDIVDCPARESGAGNVVSDVLISVSSCSVFLLFLGIGISNCVNVPQMIKQVYVKTDCGCSSFPQKLFFCCDHCLHFDHNQNKYLPDCTNEPRIHTYTL